jgi:HD-GYP domain-containing protein (c-di-GMP phosphodiesterase class II)
MFDRVVLTRDLVDCAGAVLAPRGAVVSVGTVRESARAASPAPKVLLVRSGVAAHLHHVIADPPYRHLFRTEVVRSAVTRVLLEVRLPLALFDELRALHAFDASRYRHALATSAITVAMLLAAVGDARALPDLAAAGLLHDLGMRHVPPALARGGGGPLDGGGARELAAHPLLGALHLALLLGPHPAVEAALSHHWRAGAGYPVLTRAPSRSAEVVAVASAFAALTQSRSYRSAPFDARGAADLLADEARLLRADAGAVRLLVHALRGGAPGQSGAVQLGRKRLEPASEVNRHPLLGLPDASA